MCTEQESASDRLNLVGISISFDNLTLRTVKKKTVYLFFTVKLMM